MRKKQLGNYLRYSDGEVVFEEGSDGREVYFIAEGEAEISRHVGGRKTLATILKKGDIFGEMAALNNDRRSMTVKAIGDLHLYELSLEDLFKYMQNNAEILQDVFTSLIKRLLDTNLKLKEMIIGNISVYDSGEDWTMQLYTDRLNVLAVEDEPNTALALKNLLKDDHNVFTAPDGISALRIMKLHDIDLVITDYRMPGITGIELLQNVKEKYPNAIRIILTGYADHEALIKGAEVAHAHDILLKPWQNEVIKYTIMEWGEQYRKIRRLEAKAKRYDDVRSKLAEAQTLVSQLMQEIKEMRIDEEQQPKHRKWFKRKDRVSKQEED